jgi:predicted HTH transcriptional regulator
MEGFGVKKIMESLKEYGLTVSQIVHDKDASTMKQAMDVFQDVEEGLCLCNIFLFN